ncbi:thioredoxin family protein [Rariglobus hedericola]|uniref:Thioredoxin family protein n=1 Tax=Rariglobus hedericola TaxID=2597822 RepID=A0A556QJ36_9BACT|nr:thioredoxin family protein [Rariglobus hedericola]TSJ76621.1 thioredoxin family protein [Rariglobus hedericola]
MKRILISLFFAALTLGSLNAADAKWLTNYDAAVKQAAAQKKPLLIDFTGSDWCGWCIRLDKEVFSQPEFVDYASKNLVLLKLDFPREKELPAAQKAQNEKLAKKYEVQGYPTIVVLDATGKQVGELGYEKGGPTKWIASLEKVTKK